MKKHVFLIFCMALFISSWICAQNTDRAGAVTGTLLDANKVTNTTVNTTTNPTTNTTVGVFAFKPRNPKEDKSDQFEIRSLGGTTFTASNISDGTANSYRHTLLINVALIPEKTGNNNFQLVFYSPSEYLQEAANYKEGTLNIYYPISMYEGIKEKLAESLAAKKKIYVKVVQRTDGYREGSLIF